MSECNKKPDPTTFDLHMEQARQGTILNGVRDDVREIKEVLLGQDKRGGLVMDVDRLKGHRKLSHAISWFFFTSFAASIIGAVVVYFTK